MAAAAAAIEEDGAEVIYVRVFRRFGCGLS